MELKRYILLADGHTIDQNSKPVKEEDIVIKGKDTYIKYKDYVLDGYAYNYYGIIMVVGSWQRKSTFDKHYWEYRKLGKYFFSAMQVCIASINAYAEHHIHQTDELYEKLIKEKPDQENKLKNNQRNQNEWYIAMHHSMEELKKEMNWMCGIFADCDIEYFGQGGCRPPKVHWYDSPFGFHKGLCW